MGPSRPDTASTGYLPTGETVRSTQSTKRVHFDGFPDFTTPLPPDIQDEEIIKDRSNHLWGPLLLNISANWSPKEVGDLNGTKLKPNTIIKRIAAAKKQAGVQNRKGEVLKKESMKLKRALKKDDKKKKNRELSEQAGTKRKRTSTKDGHKKKDEGKEEKELELPPESEASRTYREDQEALLKAVIAKDPGFHEHQMMLRKKNAQRNRQLLEEVVEERKTKRLRL